MRLLLKSMLSLRNWGVLASLTLFLSISPASAKVIKGSADAKSETGMKEYTEKIGDGDGEHVLVPVKGGEFLLGSPEGEEGRKEEGDKAPLNDPLNRTVNASAPRSLKHARQP